MKAVRGNVLEGVFLKVEGPQCLQVTEGLVADDLDTVFVEVEALQGLQAFEGVGRYHLVEAETRVLLEATQTC